MSFALDTAGLYDDVSEVPAVAGKIGDAADQIAADAEPVVDEQPEPEAPEQPEPVAIDEPDDDDAEIEDAWWEEIELLGRIAQCERDRQLAAAKLDHAKEHAKDCKKQLEACVIELQELASELIDLSDGKTLVKRAKVTKEPEATQASVVVQSDNAWRVTPTGELLAGIKGIGAKKLEKLIDAAPTAGALEDLRGQASKDFAPFKDALPAGFGQAAADAIEEKLLDHIANGNTPSAAEQVKQNAPAMDETAADEPTEIAKQIVELRSESEVWSLNDCDTSNEELEETIEGHNAYHAGFTIETCPFEAWSTEAELWIYGYLCGERAKQINDEAAKAKDDGPAFDADDL